MLIENGGWIIFRMEVELACLVIYFYYETEDKILTQFIISLSINYFYSLYLACIIRWIIKEWEWCIILSSKHHLVSSKGEPANYIELCLKTRFMMV